MSPDEPDVLAANSAFYEAFSRRDVAAMEALWSRRAPVACVHPGWGALRGRQRVMESWRAILGHDDAPEVRMLGATAHVLGDTAFVVCQELLPGGRLVATNLFVREEGAWKLAHHQAGPVHQEADGDDEDEDLTPTGLLN